MALVPIPWQPHLFLTPDTLALLVAASARRGRNLYLVGDDAAWRPYEVQARYYRAWVAYQAYLRGGKWAPKANPASDPDVGMRQHLRGAAFDLRDTDPTTQAACRAVGLVRDGTEAWHWNNPRWASMPIIKTNTAVSSGNVTPIQEDDLSAAAEAKIDAIYTALMGKDQPYSNIDVIISNVQPTHDALLKPGPFTGNTYRPIDVLLSNATATGAAVAALKAGGTAGVIDTKPILDAIAALPVKVRQEIKNAL